MVSYVRNDELTRVCIVYPADPVGVIPGGIDTFIRGVLRWAPQDIRISVVGVTTEPGLRPVGQWTICDLGRLTCDFYPVISLEDPGGRSRIPLSVQFTLGLLLRRPMIDADVLEFHRLEPSLVYLRDKRPHDAVMHQNMKDLSNKQSDILWSRWPGFYFWLEARLIPRFSEIYCVREDAVAWYRTRYPAMKDRFSFLPTWYDPEIFFPAVREDRKELRAALRMELGLQDNSTVVITVGRLDAQKDPILMVKSFRILAQKHDSARLVFVGDGVLREQTEAFVHECGISGRVKFAGLQPTRRVADMLRASDIFVLSSAYEGMPMCILEALGAGIPVVTTDVGEVRKVVQPGKNGYIVSERTPEALANAMHQGLMEIVRLEGVPCTTAVATYVPERVLAPVYKNYRLLAGKKQSA